MNRSRRSVETLLLAVVAMTSVLPLRAHVEARSMFLSEMIGMGLLFCIGVALSQKTKYARLALWLAPVVPILFALVTRRFAVPIAFEMTALTVFGAISIALACGAKSRRLQAISLIVGGFLVLFCTTISDSSDAIFYGVVWMLGCVWHLVANHWERLDLAMPESVTRTWTLKPSTAMATALVLAVGGYAAKDRFAPSNQLAFGIMPTSGGSHWSDPAARSGVGSGDQVIAARDHAESFGAVDSDIFLESTESSLFDMFNDQIGDPKLKQKIWERRQAMGKENLISTHERAAKSELGGGSFSTQRIPPKTHREFQDVIDDSVVQWDGPTGIRLAMHRYDTFDGQNWNQTADLEQQQLSRVEIEEAVWFFEPETRELLLRDPDATSVGLLKIIRLDSNRLPVPMTTAGIHIKEVDRQDFFGIAKDGSFYMPDRERVPPLTVVHVASVTLSEDQIRDQLKIQPASSRLDGELAAYVAKWTAQEDSAFDKLQSIVEHLRTEFRFAREGRSAARTLDEFLQSRQGGDHLFATAAALMGRHLGLSTRLVTGFYVRPDAFEVTAGHASVVPSDVHVWAEVQLEDGRWFEIEPTPGYQPPDYRPSWRLVARQFASAHWPMFVFVAVATPIAYLSRCYWVDWLLTLIWNLARWLRPRRRVRLAIGIIEARARLAGQHRPAGKTQRSWLEQLTCTDAKLAAAARQFSDSADVLFFGFGNEPPLKDATRLVDLLRVRTILQLTEEATT